MNPQKKRIKGFSLIELLIVVAIILIITAIAIPNLLRSKISANEASAVGSLRTINMSSVTYASIYGTYPPALSDLGPSANPTSLSADLIDAVLVTGIKSGYTFSYVAGVGNTTFVLHADPVTKSTGTRHFYTDQSGVIRANTSVTATSSSSPIS